MAYQRYAENESDVLMPPQPEAPVGSPIGVVVCVVCGVSRAFADVRVLLRRRRGVHDNVRRARSRDPPTPQR